MGDSFVDLLVYVDDVLLVGPNEAGILSSKFHLREKFTNF